MPLKASILIIDDDPVHLQIYRLVLESAGFRGLPALVSQRGVQFPEEDADAVLLDYRLAPNISARDVALEVRSRYPSAPILLLSDMHEAPSDIASIVQAFVRKGSPEQLLATLHKLIEQGAAKAS